MGLVIGIVSTDWLIQVTQKINIYYLDFTRTIEVGMSLFTLKQLPIDGLGIGIVCTDWLI